MTSTGVERNVSVLVIITYEDLECSTFSIAQQETAFTLLAATFGGTADDITEVSRLCGSVVQVVRAGSFNSRLEAIAAGEDMQEVVFPSEFGNVQVSAQGLVDEEQPTTVSPMTSQLPSTTASATSAITSTVSTMTTSSGSPMSTTSSVPAFAALAMVTFADLDCSTFGEDDRDVVFSRLATTFSGAPSDIEELSLQCGSVVQLIKAGNFPTRMDASQAGQDLEGAIFPSALGRSSVVFLGVVDQEPGLATTPRGLCVFVVQKIS